MKLLILTVILIVYATAQLNGQNILFLHDIFDSDDPEKMDLLQQQLELADEVVLLGDFVWENAAISESQAVKALLKFNGQVHWVPGKKEWGNIRGNAADNLKFLSKELQEIDTSWSLSMANACPGPVVHNVSQTLALVFVNTSWWLHEGEKPEPGECGIEDISGFFVALDEVLASLDHSKVLVVGYHPLSSFGPHGGYLPGYIHLLPPVGGSLYALYRKHFGGRHDLSNYFYQDMREGYEEILTKYPDVTFVSALDRSFQYIPEAPAPQLIIGTLGKPTLVHPDSEGLSLPGVLMVSSSEESTATYHSPGNIEKTVTLNPNQQRSQPQQDVVEEFPTMISARATEKLRKDQKRPGLLGRNYRAEWEAVIDSIPVFDLGKKKGGLTIEKRGGGMQTRSLRLEASDGKQYVLRSIEKYPEKAVPVELRNTIAEDIIADQVSASHPYGAFVIPVLAEAAGVYHTNPELVYLPDDPRLGKYQEDFGDGLYLFEERPDDDWRDQDSFGNSKKIMSTADVVEKLENDGDHIINQEQTVRSRLFDIWIGDWDRHDDQWRWARYKGDDEHDFKYYSPIPRDRDQAFFWSDGSLLKSTSRRWAQPKFQGFNEEIRDVAGLEFNARHFDRTFLTGANRDLWLSIAADLQKRMTDEVIDSAIRTFPDEIYALHGQDIERKLKKRREDLIRYAEEYYLFLSDIVTITASDKEDLFEIERKDDGQVEVSVFRIKGKSGAKKYRYFHRVFQPHETREIRLYAFGDDDIIKISGNASGGPTLRVIGGKGDDIVTDTSRVEGWSRKTLVYDKQGTEITSGGEVRSRLSSRDDINRYDRYAFKFNTSMPLITGGYNPDDGLFFGGGINIIRHGFRKDPYKVRHRILASLAPRSGSYNLSYQGRFVDLFGTFDLRLLVDVYEPSFADFFYGFGNQTDFNDDLFDDDHQFYRVRYGQWILKPLLSKTSRNNKHTFAFGPTFRSVEIEADENEEGERFISLYAELAGRGSDSENPLLESRRNYLGFQANYSLDMRDNDIFPLRGIHFNVEAAAIEQLNEEQNSMQQVSSFLTFYTTFGAALRTTLAIRTGGQVNTGTYEFYQAARLGGMEQIRGYRKFRFAGDKTFYNNIELRTKVLQFETFLFPAQIGILLFHDTGRVWENAPDEPVRNPGKNTWHRGYGGGIWIAPLGKVVISADYGVSNDDENAFFLRFGFMF